MNHAIPPTPDDAVGAICHWLGELGSRWGLPAEACRVHGYLYLHARPVTAGEIASSLAIEETQVEEALSWLAERRLVAQTGVGSWLTLTDPWELVNRALDERRARELEPALAILRRGRETAGDSAVARQIDKLLSLISDIAAIDAQARRLSPASLRRLLRAGGSAARLINRALR